MGRYRIHVATGAWLFSGSFNRVQLWLVGERGEAELDLQLLPVQGQVSAGSRDPNPRRWVRGRPLSGVTPFLAPAPTLVLAASTTFPGDPRPVSWDEWSQGRSQESRARGELS